MRHTGWTYKTYIRPDKHESGHLGTLSEKGKLGRKTPLHTDVICAVTLMHRLKGKREWGVYLFCLD